MSLLPKNHQEFRQKEYWDSFFKKRGKRAFEWYGEYGELCGILHKYIKPTDNILSIGCGNSTLSADLYDVGYKKQKNIDLSDTAIRQMNHLHNVQRPELTYEKMDATSMDYDNDAFSVVIDKGTLDAMMPDESLEVVANVYKLFSEIERVLRLGGRYICISLLQPHILNHLVEWFVDHGWPLRILRCSDVDASKAPEDRIFPVFAIVATKFRKMNDMKPVLEISLSSGQTHLTRLKRADELIGSVRGIQQFAAVRAGIAKGQLFECDDARQADVSLDLLTADSNFPRYSFYLVDRDPPHQMPFAVFIVPQGREAEWLFSSKEGRMQLADSTQVGRLLVVHLNREHNYSDQDHIKDELSGYVMELAPHEMPNNVKVPFLSLGGEVDVGLRHERCRGKSQLSGEYVVEDVTVNGEIYRRLIFFNNPKLIQSEARITTLKKKKHVDKSYLSCAHHSVMIGSLGFFLNFKESQCLIIGLGGGGLATYINTHFEKVHVTAIEIDEAIVRVAKDQFGFNATERLKVINEDGIEFINNFAKKQGLETARFNVIMFDIDSKNPKVGMSSPPQAFVDPDFLSTVKQCLCHSHGIFVLNMACRDPLLRSEVIQDIHKVFKTVWSYRVPEEVNEILFCTDHDEWAAAEKKLKIDRKHPAIEAFAKVNTHTKVVQKSCNARNEEELLDLGEAVKQLKLV